ncbi:DUF11 domain-containing protein [Lysobacter enzymogenes]|uniref:DUF7933 domain-containing protein n=1 Tax=Lysobacter enzymogenes TaxID=69 RepID=UPI001A978780|nr:DUF11 domain-containing protein [Lysobacter enzymogenes]QQP94158.1 DUF11 domain-containing protein [Lysobacter enzymogenes]
MNRSTQLGRKAGALLCAFALAFAGTVLASGATSQRVANATGGVQTNGSDGLRVTWGSNSQFQVRLGNADQVYNTGATPTNGTMFNSVYLRVERSNGVRVYNNANNAATAQFLQFTQVSQDPLSGDGSVATPFTTRTVLRPNNTNDSGITLTVIDSYIRPQAWFTRRLELSGMPATGATIKVYQNVDTYLQGDDNGPGFSRTTPGNTSGRPNLVGVAKGDVFEALWWEPSSGTPNWDRYFSGEYTFPQWQICNGTNTQNNCNASGGNLSNTINAASVDNGMAAQWNVPSGAATFAAEYRITFALSSVDLIKRFAPTTINAGGVSTLTFDLSNKSVNGANSVAFTDTLPANVVVAPTPNVRTSCPNGGALGTALNGMTVTATAGSGTISVAAASVNGATGNGTARTCQIAVDVTSNVVGVYHNTNASISNTANLVNLVGDEVLTVVRPQLTASKSVSGALAAGQNGIATDGYFNIGIQNSGSGATSGAITIADTLPAGFSLVSASSAQGPVSCGTLPATGTVTCTFTPTAPIAAGDSATVRLNVAIPATATGSPINHVALAGGGDPDPLPACPAAGNPQCAQTPAPIAVNVGLSLVKSELTPSTTYTPGRPTTYTLQACNPNGPAVANGATINDPLPAGTRLSASWQCTGTGGGTCPASGGAINDASVAIAGVVLPVGACINVQVPVLYNPSPTAY